jgi:hypothetical protein
MSSEELYEKKYLKYKAKYFQLKEMEEQMEGGGIFSAVKSAASAAKTALPSKEQLKSAALTAASAAKTVAASPYAQAAAQTALANPEVQARLAKLKQS